MTREEFKELTGKEVVILDGATGSNLMKQVCQEEFVQKSGFVKIRSHLQNFKKHISRQEVRLFMRLLFQLIKSVLLIMVWKIKYIT